MNGNSIFKVEYCNFQSCKTSIIDFLFRILCYQDATQDNHNNGISVIHNESSRIKRNYNLVALLRKLSTFRCPPKSSLEDYTIVTSNPGDLVRYANDEYFDNIEAIFF